MVRRYGEMKMATLNKQATYFKQVADVIGEEQAEIELQKVIDYGIGFDDEEDVSITSAFIFHESPQGFTFWSEISDEVEGLDW